MIKAVLFDMDGVLIDSHDAWLDRFNSALKHFGFKKISGEEFDKYVWAINFAETVNKYYPGKAIGEVREYYEQTFDEFIKKVRRIKNVDEAIEYIKNKKLKTAVVSNTQSSLVEKILAKIGIEGYFDLIVGGERVKSGKPNPEIILIACKELRLKPEETVLIGDTVYDKQAAEAAGCMFIGYKIDGDKRIDDLKELMDVI